MAQNDPQPHVSKDSDAISTTPPKQISFLTLPAELRIQIYDIALIKPFKLEMSFLKSPDKTTHIPGSLLRTCKQIHREANSILYSRNTFHTSMIGSNRNALAWLNRIGDANASLITSASFEFRTAQPMQRHHVFRFVDEFTEKATALEVIDLWVGARCDYVVDEQAKMFERFVKLPKLRKVIASEKYSDWTFSVLRNKFKETKVEVEYHDFNTPGWVERAAEIKVLSDRAFEMYAVEGDGE